MSEVGKGIRGGLPVRPAGLILCGGRSFFLPLTWCMALLSAVGAINYPPMAGAQGVDAYTKLMLHADGSDQGTSFTDSSSGAKTVTNNNMTFSSSAYKMGGYSGVFNGSNAYLGGYLRVCNLNP